MKTTTKKMQNDIDGNTTRTDESGREIYSIWSNGVVWVYQENPERTFELDERGGWRQWCDASINWVEVNSP